MTFTHLQLVGMVRNWSLVPFYRNYNDFTEVETLVVARRNNLTFLHKSKQSSGLEDRSLGHAFAKGIMKMTSTHTRRMARNVEHLMRQFHF